MKSAASYINTKSQFLAEIMVDIEGDNANHTITLIDDAAIRVIQEQNIPFSNPRMLLPLMVDIQSDNADHIITVMGLEAKEIIRKELPYTNARRPLIPLGKATIKEIQRGFQKELATETAM